MTSAPVTSIESLLAVESRLSEVFAAERERARQLDDHATALWDELSVAAAGGKRVRPRLVLDTFTLLGGHDLHAAVDFAVAIELLHTALLLHDDVIDGDLERRGERNLVGRHRDAAVASGVDEGRAQRWGESSAIIGGDLLLAASIRLTALIDIDAHRRARLLELLDEALQLAAAGERADVAFAHGVTVPDAEDVRQMMRAKTAGYSFDIPLRAAAVLAGADDALASRLGEIGQRLGLVFQMQDDLLGVFGVAHETGKSTISDLREGKQTLLVAHARGHRVWEETAPGRFGDPALDDVGAEVLRGALEAVGARARAEQELAEEAEHVRALLSDGVVPRALAEALLREVQTGLERRA